MVFLRAISNFLPVSWCFYWQIFRPTDGNSRLPKVQKVDTQIALTLTDDGWLWCDFLFCWYVVFVAKTNSHAREGVRSFKWLLSWIVKYSIIFSEKKENRHQKWITTLTSIQLIFARPYSHPYTALLRICTTLSWPIYSSFQEYITEQPNYKNESTIKLMYRLKWKLMRPYY